MAKQLTAKDLLTENLLQNFEKLDADEKAKFIKKLEERFKDKDETPFRDSEPESNGATDAWEE